MFQRTRVNLLFGGMGKIAGGGKLTGGQICKKNGEKTHRNSRNYLKPAINMSSTIKKLTTLTRLTISTLLW